MPPRLDLAGYLRRLAIPDPAAPSPERLRALHAAHVERIPYEAIEIQLGRPTTVDPVRLGRARHADRLRPQAHRPGPTSPRTLETQNEWFDALADVFDLPLTDVSRRERETLWARVHDAHEAWLAAQYSRYARQT